MKAYIITVVCLVGLNVLLCNKMAAATPTYTKEEEIALPKFRELVKDDLYEDYMKSDYYLVRWLRAKNFDQNDAAVMLRKSLKWRKDNKIDGIMDEVIYDGLPPYFADGIDKEGSPIATILASRWDTRSFIVAGKRSVPIRYWAQLYETVQQIILKNLGLVGNTTLEGDATHIVTTIISLHGYNLRQHACLSCFSVYFEWFDILENYYPGFAKHLFFINTPRIFQPLLELLKPLMAPQTRNALKVYGTNKAEWHPAIIGKIVPPDQVRAAFGGTKPE